MHAPHLPSALRSRPRRAAPPGPTRRAGPAAPAPSLLALGGALLVLGAAGCSSSETTSPPEPVYPEKDRAAEAARLLSGADWYRHAVFYEVYVRSFQDSDGDGIGDLPGLTARLDDLKALGVDALWLMPVMPSPLADSGYDVSDYRAIHPDYGSMDDFDALLAAAHARGMRVTIDLVLNHTSVEHPWFQESRRDRTNPRAGWYVWSDTPSRADVPCGPIPGFSSTAWAYDAVRGQYYFHRFLPAQPELDYWNPDVAAEALDVARFWLDRGVDGFRCDVIGLLYESAAGCNLLPETLAFMRRLRAVLDGYPGRAMVAEPVSFGSTAPFFGDGTDTFHMAFDLDFAFGWPGYFDAPAASPVAEHFVSLLASLPAGAQSATQVTNHDLGRAFARGGGVPSRWRRAAFLQLTMPGTPFLYYGEELALRPGTAEVVDARDHGRTPMLWSAGPGWGFTTGQPWIAFGAEPDRTNLAAERSDSSSDYAFFRELLALRRGREAFGTGSLRVLPTDDPSILLWVRESRDETYVLAVGMDEGATRTGVARDANLPGDPRRLLGGARLSREGTSARVTVPPGGLGAFRVR
jgi:glycosidase